MKAKIYNTIHYSVYSNARTIQIYGLKIKITIEHPWLKELILACTTVID